MDEESQPTICPVCEANLELSPGGWKDGEACPACSTELHKNEQGQLESSDESTARNVAEQPGHFESLDLDSLLAEEERRKRQELERKREKAEERRRAEEEQKRKEKNQRRLEKIQRKSEVPVEPELPGLELAETGDNLDEVAAELDELALDDLEDSQKRAFGLKDTPGDDADDGNWSDALAVEGIAKQLSDERVFGMKCHVCDTLLHARVSQVGTRIECPDCFTSLTVPDAPPAKGPTMDHPSNEKNDEVEVEQSHDDGELKLSDPVERPTSDLPQEFGLEPPQPNLLAPKPAPRDETEASQPQENPAPPSEEDEPDNPLQLAPLNDEPDPIPDPLATPPMASPSTTPTDVRTSGNSFNEKDVKRKEDTGRRRRSKREAFEEIAQNEEHELFESGDVVRDMTPFTAESLYSRLVSALTAPGLLIRAGIAILILTVSAIFFSTGESYRSMEEKGGAQWLAMAGNYLVFAACWLTGMLVLLRAASVLFRDSALGHVRVESWRMTGLEDAKSTLLLFAFSYMIACSPFLGLWLLTKVPLGSGMALLIAPFLLLGAWFNQSPFQVLSLDSFVDVRNAFGDWRWLYTYLVLLAAVSIVGGLIFWFEYWPLYVAAAGMQTISLLAFASLCGWHTGRVVQRIEESV